MLQCLVAVCPGMGVAGFFAAKAAWQRFQGQQSGRHVFTRYTPRSI